MVARVPAVKIVSKPRVGAFVQMNVGSVYQGLSKIEQKLSKSRF